VQPAFHDSREPLAAAKARLRADHLLARIPSCRDFTTSAVLKTGASGQKSGHVLGDEAPGRQGATREHSRPYVTEEQRSRTGWIGSQNMPEILTGGTRAEGT